MIDEREYEKRMMELRRLKHNEMNRNYRNAHLTKMRAYWKNWVAEHPGYFSKEARERRKAEKHS